MISNHECIISQLKNNYLIFLKNIFNFYIFIKLYYFNKNINTNI